MSIYIILMFSLGAFVIGSYNKFGYYTHLFFYGLPMGAVMWLLKTHDLEAWQSITGGLIFILLLYALWTYPTK